jgi:hypothetical protein
MSDGYCVPGGPMGANVTAEVKKSGYYIVRQRFVTEKVMAVTWAVT